VQGGLFGYTGEKEEAKDCASPAMKVREGLVTEGNDLKKQGRQFFKKKEMAFS